MILKCSIIFFHVPPFSLLIVLDSSVTVIARQTRALMRSSFRGEQKGLSLLPLLTRPHSGLGGPFGSEMVPVLCF